MSNVYGDLKLLNGRIYGLKLEPVDTIPTFTPGEDIGSIIFDTNEGAVKVWDGAALHTLQFSNNTSDPLLDTLGRNWIEHDLSFNPTDFNSFDNISGLTANDTLFDVFAGLDAAISNVRVLNFMELQDVYLPSNATSGDVLILQGSGNFTVTSMSFTDLIAFHTTLGITDLTDYKGYDLASGDHLIFQSRVGGFVNHKIYEQYENTAIRSTFTVNHSLSNYCIVQVMDYNTGVTINNATITQPFGGRVIIDLDEAKAVRVLMFAHPDLSDPLLP